MSDLNLIKPKYVQNIINKFCVSIGMIPTSYKNALTYEKQILAIGNYLENVVYPAINNNAEAVAELQNLFIELKDYVDNYFDNLDIQEEINNKLDEMAKGGQLSDIIAQYLELQAVLGFNDITDMKNATYITNGSLLRTYGQDTLNDGKGAFYYVRNVQTTDVIDNVNIVALHDTNLVAIKCMDYNINQLKEQLQNTDFILNDECKIYFPYRGQNAGDCTVIQNNGKNIIIDFGWNADNLISWLLNKNITKIDYIILSHYHADHIGGNYDTSITMLDFLSDSRFNFNDLIVYLPHKGINYSELHVADKTIVENNEIAIKQYLTNNNIEYIEPNNGDILELSDISSIKFLNIGTSFYQDYYGNYGNEYNNFSMVCELNHNNRIVLFTGDIYNQAQAKMVNYIKQPDIVKAPHHLLEPVYDGNFMKKITASIMVFQENQDYSSNSYITNPFYQNCKNQNANIYSNNISQNIEILLKNDSIIQNSTNGIYTLHSVNVMNGSGIHINNIDLNNLIDVGNYYTNSNTETNTLNNRPLQEVGDILIGTSFGRASVIVMSIDIDKTFLIQMFYSGNSLFVRHRSYIENQATWTPWLNMNNTNILEPTTQIIPNGSDLNNYFTPGKYQITNNSAYNSLVNKPSSNQGGSTLIVMTTRYDTDIRQQFIITANGNIFHRILNMNNYNTAIGTAGSWKQISETNV